MPQRRVRYGEWLPSIERSLELACKTACIELKESKKTVTKKDYEKKTLDNLKMLIDAEKSRHGSEDEREELEGAFVYFMKTWGKEDREPYRRLIDESFEKCKNELKSNL